MYRFNIPSAIYCRENICLIYKILQKMNVPEINTKTIRVKKKRTLADGTIKEYECNRTYKLKGYANNGRNEKLTNEQKVQIVEKYNSGITITRLCKDYNCVYATIKKVISNK